MVARLLGEGVVLGRYLRPRVAELLLELELERLVSSAGRKPRRVAAVTLQKPPAIWFAIAGQLPPIQLAISTPT